MTPAVRIQARSPRGHRRCGLRHPPQPVLHPPGTFNDDDIRALRDDPRLLVEIVGDLAMGALSGPEIATVMADAFREGTVLTGWDAHATSALPEVVAATDIEGGADVPPPDAGGTDAGEPDAGGTDRGKAVDAPPPATTRTRKPKAPS